MAEVAEMRNAPPSVYSATTLTRQIMCTIRCVPKPYSAQNVEVIRIRSRNGRVTNSSGSMSGLTGVRKGMARSRSSRDGGGPVGTQGGLVDLSDGVLGQCVEDVDGHGHLDPGQVLAAA